MNAIKPCSSCGAVPPKPLHCSACKLVNYCSSTCQKDDWKRHKICCKKIMPLLQGEFLFQHGSDKESEFRQKGTSYGDPARMNEEAENISPAARKLKQGGCYDQAVAMYTRCLELDCYNHFYYFHRAETLLVSMKNDAVMYVLFVHSSPHPHHILSQMASNGPRSALSLLEPAVWDCKYAITLDPTLQAAWSLLIRCLTDLHELEEAEYMCEEALRRFPRGAERHEMFKTMKYDIHKFKKQLQNKPDSFYTYEVADHNDSLYFFYTDGMARNGHPEVLSVDLPFPEPCSNRIMGRLKKEKDDSGSFPFSLGTSIWIHKTKQWVSPIPVTNEKHRKQILKYLMTRTKDKKSKIVVLKVDGTSKESRPEPLTEEQAEAYIGEIVKNASKTQALYNRGEKLVADSFIASLLVGENGISSAFSHLSI